MVKIDLDKNALAAYLQQALASLKRARNTPKSPQFIPILEADINRLQTAINTMVETK